MILDDVFIFHAHTERWRPPRLSEKQEKRQQLEKLISFAELCAFRSYFADSARRQTSHIREFISHKLCTIVRRIKLQK